MRIFILLGIAVILTACQPHKVTRQDDLNNEGRDFYITHPVDFKEKDYPLQHQKMKVRSKPSVKYVTDVKDGAPPGPLPTSFKKVIPKYEPISRYGNPDSYQVMGKHYEVMTNSTGYKSRGIASWYGTKFHSVRTSSGEKYDMYALTAAHKTLPLPSYIKVKNLTNGRELVVRVNDRGPFHESRILDLSYAAAAKLGLFPKGTALVEIEALKTTQQSLHYYLQAGAFESPQLAAALSTQLGKLTTSPVYVQNHQNRYIVQVGPFGSRDLANHLKQRLENNGIHGSFSRLM